MLCKTNRCPYSQVTAVCCHLCMTVSPCIRRMAPVPYILGVVCCGYNELGNADLALVSILPMLKAESLMCVERLYSCCFSCQCLFWCQNIHSVRRCLPIRSSMIVVRSGMRQKHCRPEPDGWIVGRLSPSCWTWRSGENGVCYSIFLQSPHLFCMAKRNYTPGLR